MDQSNDPFPLESKCGVNNGVISPTGKNEKKKVARRRWAILAKALKSPVGSEPSSPTDEFSVRRISSFMLLRTQLLPSFPIQPSCDLHLTDQINKRTWYKYSTKIDELEFFLNIGHRNRTFSAEDLMGFNNTGNICIWPSEETLSYYVCSNLTLFANKTALELGGGMSCLAGLFAAKYGQAKSVTVTDGNKVSVENVQVSLYRNEFSCMVDCKVLKWDSSPDVQQQYDVVLCADCLFFDDARNDLIECLWSCLHSDGVALVMAPQRGSTLASFVAQSEAKGFNCRKLINYNQVVWEKRADYWVSQNRKYCDFCKCWITDNKPSVDFHEKGRRHQENVKKRLKTITRHSAQVQKDTDKMDATLKRMEAAAMESYRRDVENNADITSQNLNKQLQDGNLAIAGGSGSITVAPTKLWNETRGKDGKTSYYNIMTNETVYTKPKEGYSTLQEQREQAELQAKHQLAALDKYQRKEAMLKMQVDKKQEEEERARLAREKLKARRVVDDDPPPVVCGPLLEPGKTEPYGKWHTVQEVSVPDLQLPQQEEYLIEVPEIVPEPVVKEFKEKTVESLGEAGDSSVVTFKKRKFGSGAAKRNARQRLDDD